MLGGTYILTGLSGSGSGKSTLAKLVAERLGEHCSRVPADYYLQSRVTPMAEFMAQSLEYDWDLLSSHLSLGDGAEVSVPDFDFVNFQRRNEDGGPSYMVRRVMIVDSMLPYPKADTFIYIETPVEVRRQRIRERDKRWETNVIELWSLHQVTLGTINWQHQRVDMRLDGLRPIEENAERVVKELGIRVHPIFRI